MKIKNIVTVLLVASIIASCVPNNSVIPTETVAQTNTSIPISTPILVPTTTPTATTTKILTPTSTPYPSKGGCPLDLSQEDISIFALFKGPDHPGLDIAAPKGTPHISPGDCTVLYFYIEDNGGQGVQLRCTNLPLVDRISLHHIDLSQHNYETLDYYGIPKGEIYNDDGTLIKGVFHLDPRSNTFTAWGEDLHIFSGNTGSSLPHTHINVWILVDGELVYKDPLEFLDCHE